MAALELNFEISMRHLKAKREKKNYPHSPKAGVRSIKAFCTIDFSWAFVAQLAAMKHYSLLQIMAFSFVLFTDWSHCQKLDW